MQDDIGDKKVEVSIALSVDIGDFVDRDSCDADLQFGAMNSIKPTQKILMCFAFSGVLRKIKAGNAIEGVRDVSAIVSPKLSVVEFF